MKKTAIVIVTVALMAMTACNEKPAKSENAANPEATEQVENAQQDSTAPKIDVEKAAPTADGKDHTVAEFDTKEYQIRLENLADGTYRLSMWKAGADKSGKPDQVIETKQCVMQGGSYLMKTDDGKVCVIKTSGSNGEVTIMDKEDIKKYK